MVGLKRVDWLMKLPHIPHVQSLVRTCRQETAITTAAASAPSTTKKCAIENPAVMGLKDMMDNDGNSPTDIPNTNGSFIITDCQQVAVIGIANRSDRTVVRCCGARQVVLLVFSNTRLSQNTYGSILASNC